MTYRWADRESGLHLFRKAGGDTTFVGRQVVATRKVNDKVRLLWIDGGGATCESTMDEESRK